MVDGKYALAIVGYGGMGEWHSDLIAGFDDLYVHGIFDINEKRQAYAQKKKGLKAYPDFETLLADPHVDIVLVATPNDTHKPLAIAAMKAGKNVVCEKPVTLCSADLKEMIETAEAYRVLFTVHQNRRWDGDFLTMKRIFESQMLGDVFNIESRVHGSRGIPGDWRGKKEHGGGMVLDWGVHILDQMLMMIPEKVKSVYAKLFHVTNPHVDDGFKIMLTFESGKTALCEVGTSNFVNLPRWYMQGREGTAVIHDFKGKGKIVSVENWHEKDVTPVKTAAGLTKTMAPRKKRTITETSLPVINSDIRDYYKNVMRAIEGKEAIIVTHSQLMRSMRLMEAAFKSHELNQSVDFE